MVNTVSADTAENVTESRVGSFVEIGVIPESPERQTVA